jgi:hypothetical protein
LNFSLSNTDFWKNNFYLLSYSTKNFLKRGLKDLLKAPSKAVKKSADIEKRLQSLSE